MNKKAYKIHTHIKRHSGDLVAFLAIYAQIRQAYKYSVLFENLKASAYLKGYSYIGFDRLASFRMYPSHIDLVYPSEIRQQQKLEQGDTYFKQFRAFTNQFTFVKAEETPFFTSGWMGYQGYHALVDGALDVKNEPTIPIAWLHLYKNCIVFEHKTKTLYLVQHQTTDIAPDFSIFDQHIQPQSFLKWPFSIEKNPVKTPTDKNFEVVLEESQAHCQQGEIYALYPAQKVEYPAKGDSFQLYRKVHRFYQAPYSFFAEYSDFQLFGASFVPQLVLEAGKANMQVNIPEAHQPPSQLSAWETLWEDVLRGAFQRCSAQVTIASKTENEQVALDVLAPQGNADWGHWMGAVSPRLDKIGVPKAAAVRLLDRYEHVPRDFYTGSIGFYSQSLTKFALMEDVFMYKGGKLSFFISDMVTAWSDLEQNAETAQQKFKAIEDFITQSILE